MLSNMWYIPAYLTWYYMFFSAIVSLEKFIHRSENINSAYTKYKDSAFTLGKALTDASSTLKVISGHWWVVYYYLLILRGFHKSVQITTEESVTGNNEWKCLGVWLRLGKGVFQLWDSGDFQALSCTNVCKVSVSIQTNCSKVIDHHRSHMAC